MYEAPAKYNLTSQQREAVEYPGRYALINSGPGSGKTRVLTERVRWFIEKGIDPRTILLLTFTNRAARVMHDRIGDSVGEQGRPVLASTFHSFCNMVLRSHIPPFTIIDDKDQLRILGRLMVGMTVRVSGFTSEQTAAEHINTTKGQGISAEVDGNYLYIVYERYLRDHDLVDFGGLQLNVLPFLEEDTQYKNILIDEYHDTSPVQLDIIQLLDRHADTLTVVCDDQQSIYQWRGATIDNILTFPDIFPGTKVMHLERNFRSTKAIVETVNRLISCATEKLPGKNLFSMREYGIPPIITCYYNHLDEANAIAKLIAKSPDPPNDHFVLYRTNGQSRVIEAALATLSIPYQVIAALSFYRRAEIKDVIAYLRVVYNSNDEDALTRIINVPRRGIGKKGMENFIEKHESLCNALKNSDDKKLKPLQVLLAHLRDYASKNNIAKIVKEVVRAVKYIEMLEDKRDRTTVNRVSNVKSLIIGALEYERTIGKDHSTLGEYLAVISLMSDSDGMKKDNCTKLMSIHASKGLEAKHVYILGAEEGLIPHALSVRDGTIDEERRLFYVALSRAADTVHVSHCETRFNNKWYVDCDRSRFIDEITPTKDQEIF